MIRALSSFLIALAFCAVASAAFADKRVALVIGNSNYQGVSRLANPASDAAMMSATFRAANFDVVESRNDLAASDMRRALRDFADKARDADIAVVYYAGHGIEVDGTNFAIPVDARLERDTDAYDEAIALDRILLAVEPAKQLRLIILDACRDNPFAVTMKRQLASRSIGRGLARVEPTSPNTMIAFAAKAGSTAADGDGTNSPFAVALANNVTKPGVDIRKAFGFVRDEVLKATGNRQEPFVYGSLGGGDVALVPAVVTPPADAVANPQRDYEFAERVGTKEAWEFFLTVHPDGYFARLAQAQLNKLATGNTVVAARGGDAPKTDDAKAVENKPATIAAPAKATPTPLPPAPARPAAPTSVAPVAALTQPEQPPAVEEKPAGPSAAELPLLLQAELRRVGCNTAQAGDIWNAAGQRALTLFNRNAKTKFDVQVASLDALNAVRSKTARVCPLLCERGFKAEGEQCVKIVCRTGFEVGDDNSCVRIRRPQAKREAPEPAPARAAAAPRSSGQIICTGTDASPGSCRPVRPGCRIERQSAGPGGGSGMFQSVEVCR